MKKILIVLVFVLSFFGYKYYSGYQSFMEVNILETEKIIEIEKNTTPTSLLVNTFGLDKNYVRIFFKKTGLNPKIEAGKYKLTPPVTVENIFEKLNNPIIEGELNFVVFEGWNIYDIDACLSDPESMEREVNGVLKGCFYDNSGEEKQLVKGGLIEKGDFIEYVTSLSTVENFSEKYNFLSKAITLEGFLQPDTYRVNKYSFTLEAFTKKLLENFDRKIMQDEELVKIYGDKLADEVANNIIIASIVEREISSPDNREEDEAEKVAGVLKKRFEENWQIGADATVCYPYKILSRECIPSFVLDKLYDKTDYNTRQMTGLPKTPISNPYYKTLKSTILSDDSEYYFYLHDYDGGIHYARDNAGHEVNKSKYLK